MTNSDLDKALMCPARNDTCPTPAYCNVHTCRARAELEFEEDAPDHVHQVHSVTVDPRDTEIDKTSMMRDHIQGLIDASLFVPQHLLSNQSLDRSVPRVDGLKVNTETLSEHQARLARSGLRLLSREEAEPLFPQHQVLNYFGR